MIYNSAKKINKYIKTKIIRKFNLCFQYYGNYQLLKKNEKKIYIGFNNETTFIKKISLFLNILNNKEHTFIFLNYEKGFNLCLFITRILKRKRIIIVDVKCKDDKKTIYNKAKTLIIFFDYKKNNFQRIIFFIAIIADKLILINTKKDNKNIFLLIDYFLFLNKEILIIKDILFWKKTINKKIILEGANSSYL